MDLKAFLLEKKIKASEIIISEDLNEFTLSSLLIEFASEYSKKYLCYSKIIELIDQSENLSNLEVNVIRFFNEHKTIQVINLYCNCGKIYIIKKDDNAPENANSMGCNWCPKCEDTANDYYTEWYNLKN